jgi:isopentenyl-diphosphate Delta-isomerase
VRWVEIAELQHEARLNPETITPWFRIYLQRWPELRLSPASQDGRQRPIK